MKLKLEMNGAYAYERIMECVGKWILMCKIRVRKERCPSPKHIYYNNAENPKDATIPPVDISIDPSNGLIQQVTFFITEPCATGGMPDLSVFKHEGFVCVEDERFAVRNDLDLVGTFRPYFIRSSLCIYNSCLPNDNKMDVYPLGTSNQIGFDSKGGWVGLMVNDIIPQEYKQMKDAGVIK